MILSPYPAVRNIPIALSVLLLVKFSCLAAHPTRSTLAPNQPTEVKIGLFVVDLYEFSIKDESFVADFYLWMNWKGEFNPEHFEIMNGELESKEDPFVRKKDGTNYICWRCRGRFRSPLDFRNYPRDHQTLRIEIEDGFNDNKEVVYSFDKDAELEPYPISIGGFRMSGPQRYKVVNHEYKTNYGLPFSTNEKDHAVHSRMQVEIPIEHSGIKLTFIKLFLPVFLSVLIALLTFLVEPIDLDPRFGTGVAAIFGAVSSMLVANSSIPETPYFSLSDKIHLTSLLFIFISIFISCIVLKVYKTKGKEVANKIDLLTGSFLLVSYVLLMTIFCVGI